MAAPKQRRGSDVGEGKKTQSKRRIDASSIHRSILHKLHLKPQEKHALTPEEAKEMALANAPLLPGRRRVLHRSLLDFVPRCSRLRSISFAAVQINARGCLPPVPPPFFQEQSEVTTKAKDSVDCGASRRGADCYERERSCSSSSGNLHWGPWALLMETVHSAAQQAQIVVVGIQRVRRPHREQWHRCLSSLLVDCLPPSAQKKRPAHPTHRPSSASSSPHSNEVECFQATMSTLPKGFQNQLLLVFVHRSLSPDFCLLDTAAVQLGSRRGSCKEPKSSLSREGKTRSCPDLDHQLKTIDSECTGTQDSGHASRGTNAGFLSWKEEESERIFYGGVALRCMIYNSVLNFVCVDLFEEEEEDEFILPGNLTSERQMAIYHILALRHRQKRLAVDALRRQQFCSIMNSLHFKVENQWQPTITCVPLLVLGAPDLLPPGPGIIHACPSFSPSSSPRKTGSSRTSGRDVSFLRAAESSAACTPAEHCSAGEKEGERSREGRPASTGEASDNRRSAVGEEFAEQKQGLRSDSTKRQEAENFLVLDFQERRRRRAPPFFVRLKAGTDQGEKVTLAEDSRAIDLLRRKYTSPEDQQPPTASEEPFPREACKGRPRQRGCPSCFFGGVRRRKRRTEDLGCTWIQGHWTVEPVDLDPLKVAYRKLTEILLTAAPGDVSRVSVDPPLLDLPPIRPFEPLPFCVCISNEHSILPAAYSILCLSESGRSIVPLVERSRLHSGSDAFRRSHRGRPYSPPLRQTEAPPSLFVVTPHGTEVGGRAKSTETHNRFQPKSPYVKPLLPGEYDVEDEEGVLPSPHPAEDAADLFSSDAERILPSTRFDDNEDTSRRRAAPETVPTTLSLPDGSTGLASLDGGSWAASATLAARKEEEAAVQTLSGTAGNAKEYRSSRRGRSASFDEGRINAWPGCA
ncbi:hypothetical protein CSUI_003291, partial [Cystoisospora suis]